jgi:hypothetical protein
MKVALVTFPAVDIGFRSSAEANIANGAITPPMLELRLRRNYPRASVTCGIVEGDRERWYAYRDGSWIASPHE